MATTPTYPLYLGGTPQSPNRALAVSDKFTGEPFAQVPMADAATIQQAIGLAVQAERPMAAMAAFERKWVLTHCADAIRAQSERFVEVLCAEAGKPLADARTEVQRAVETFQLAAEESVRQYGEVLPVDLSERMRSYRVQWKRFPVGACSFITPFNFPLNLVAHKVAPALAAGCPFVLKPASHTPVSALLLGEILSMAGLPAGAFSVLPCHRDGAELFTTDEKLKLLSFTGSPAVGWELKRMAGRKKVVLELGGNAACVVCADWELADSLDRVVQGAFSNSGQSCISVQRVFVEAPVYAAFRQGLVERARALGAGDPRDESNRVGPLISDREADRLEGWVRSAEAAGARVLTGGKRRGRVLEPTVLEAVPTDHPLWAEEAFGPVVALAPFDGFDAVLEAVNASRFGLQAGIFTRDWVRAEMAWEGLDVGGVIIGDVPAWRSDAMPYGGVKESGLGREGVRFAIHDMTEPRVLATRRPPLVNSTE